RPSLSTSPATIPIVPKSHGRSERLCGRKVTAPSAPVRPRLTRRTPSPNSLGTYRPGQPSSLKSSHTAPSVERNPLSVPVAYVTSSNCQFPLLRYRPLPRLLPLLPSSQESDFPLPGRVTYTSIRPSRS